MNIKLIFSILLGKLILFTIKALKISGGTAAPGLFALKIDQNLVKKLTSGFKQGNIVISGTNGKTTTSRLLSDFLSEKFKIIHNRQGSNLLRGVATSLISKVSITGKVEEDIGVWEIDEAVLPQAISEIIPDIVVLLNLFRDQLDRYGEVESTRKKWVRSLSKSPKSTTFVLNADDPQIASLKDAVKGKTIFFGINGKVDENLFSNQVVADIRFCLNCSQKLNYKSIYFSHLGNYECTNCGFAKPNPGVCAQNVSKNKAFSTNFNLKIKNHIYPVNFPMPGLYNIYNVLAASSVASCLDLNAMEILPRIEKFSAAFGRFQRLFIEGKNVIIFLIKNPTGANEVLSVIKGEKIDGLLVALNDNIADGTDVSWIWDTNWELLSNKKFNTYITGTRAWDMALRLKYASVHLSNNTPYKDISYSISQILAHTSNKSTLIVLPTYTALLRLQRYLQKEGFEKWHEQ